MKVRLVVVPPGGGEADYSIFIDMPAVPRAGDYISVMREGEDGLTSLLVKRTWWTLKDNETRTSFPSGQERYGTTEEIAVECYVAKGIGFDSEAHKRVVAMYEARGKKAPEFDNSMY